jgi:hypothetical protein
MNPQEMQKCLRIVYVVIALCSINFLSRAQGCSDAGFCTMGAMKPDQPFNKKIELKLRSMEISFYRGTTSLTPVIYVATADMSFSLNRKTSFQVKLPYQAVTGRLANTSGLGDISLCITRNLYSTEKSDVGLSVGTKIPTNKSDKSTEGRPLPMYYQTSLGTYDFITGISLLKKNWLFATGIQIPLNRNDNQFLWGAWKPWIKSEDDSLYISKYARAKELKRGTDVMLRIERNFRFSRFNFSLGLLPIYRITKDSRADATGKRITEDQGKGLALSGIVTTGYSFNVRSGIKILVGHKFVQREVNPDGLTRELVTTASYFYRF